jgi:hypothetical protein
VRPVILPKSTIAGVLDGSITTARVPLSTFALSVYTDADGNEQAIPIIPKDPIALSSAHERPDDWPLSAPAPSGDPVCKLKILRCELVTLEDTTDEEARAEGFPDVDTYGLAFMDAYGKAWTGTDGYWLEFEVDRSAKKLTHRIVWDPGTEDGQYRCAPEPEGVSQAEASKFTRQARERDRRVEAQRVAWYRELPIGQQVQMALETAKSKGIDTSITEAAIKRRLKSLQNQTDKAA